MRGKVLATILISIVLASEGTLWALTGEEILKKVEERTIGKLAPSDLESVMVMTIVSSKGSKKVRELKAWSKNNLNKDDWRVMKFLSPADVRGVGFLVLAEDQMYLYLPEFRRIRRIASHNKKESFMGSDFSYEDMGTSGFSKFYSAKLLKEDPNMWVLELFRKPGVRKPYKKILMWVSKKTEIPVKLELYGNDGKLWKVLEQEVKKVEKYWLPVKMTMRNVKKGSYTVLEMKEIKVDQNLSDKIFTKRFLKRRVK